MKSRKEENLEYLEYLELPVGDIITSPDNPRIINQKGEDFLELLESVKAMGIIVPVHVRQHPDWGKIRFEKRMYELLAGERRLLAAIQAGQTKIKAINHGTLTDEQAFEITFAENFARTDLSTLEQGKAVEIMMTKYKGDTRAVAAKMGKSISWVTQRAAMNKNLSQDWKKAVSEDPFLVSWTTAHLQLIAAFPDSIQKELLEHYADEFDYNGLISVKRLEKELTERLRLLKQAPWNLADKDFINEDEEKITACSKCKKRSSYRPGLFDDTTNPEEVKKTDRCLDQNCWSVKLYAYLNRQIQQLKKEHSNLLCIATDSPDYSRQRVLRIRFPEFVEQWKGSKEGAEGAMPAMVVSGNDRCELRWIKPLIKSTSAGTQIKVKGQPTSLAERRKMLEAKRDARFLVMLAEIIAKQKVTDLVSKAEISKIRLVMALAAVFGVDQPYSGITAYYHNQVEGEKAWEKVFAIADGSTIERLWESIRTVLCNNLRYLGPVTQTEKSRIKEALQLAALFELDVKAIYKQIKKDIPAPKSWANLNTDGTPKKKAKKKKAKGKAA